MLYSYRRQQATIMIIIWAACSVIPATAWTHLWSKSLLFPTFTCNLHEKTYFQFPKNLPYP